MGGPDGPRSPEVSIALAGVFAAVAFFALAIMGLGLLSLLVETDVIVAPGFGQLPGVVAMILAVLVFLFALRMILVTPRPSYVGSVFLALGVTLAHLCGLWATAFAEGAGVVRATSAAGHLVLSGVSAVIAVSAVVAAWGGIALRRTRASRPHWPWEESRDE